jgi:hypothetical protein
MNSEGICAVMFLSINGALEKKAGLKIYAKQDGI